MSKNPKKFLFLYSELAGYMLSCMKLLAEKKQVEIYIVCWPVNKEAPFNFSFPSNFRVRQKNEFNFLELKEYVQNIQPDIIYSSGWMDKDYTKIAKLYRKKIPVITAFDNKWKGSFRQNVASLISPFTIKKYFSHCFVPGDLQYQYALKLGFKNENILKGLYAAEVDFYYQQFLANKAQKLQNFPKRFIYVGRYYAFKGIGDLWTAFTELQTEQANEWELWCFGTGDIKPIKHLKIKHFGFVQPEEQKKYIAQTGVFVLPSRIEPWAVVVHEYAAAGFPLILSDEVGSGGTFLEEGKNGFSFKSGNIAELKNAMRKMMQISDIEKNKMSELSTELAKKITPEKWVETIYSLVH
jgi:glycosyltransferase involved in cell wall biosynthesis